MLVDVGDGVFGTSVEERLARPRESHPAYPAERRRAEKLPEMSFEGPGGYAADLGKAIELHRLRQVAAKPIERAYHVRRQCRGIRCQADFRS